MSDFVEINVGIVADNKSIKSSCVTIRRLFNSTLVYELACRRRKHILVVWWFEIQVHSEWRQSSYSTLSIRARSERVNAALINDKNTIGLIIKHGHIFKTRFVWYWDE